MLKLKRIKIEQFRNVKPGTELHFSDGFNVVLGRNGTGKTTLLRFIAAAAGSDFSPFMNEAFRVEYELATERIHVAVRIENAGGNQLPGFEGEEWFQAALEIVLTFTPPAGAPVNLDVRTENGISVAVYDDKEKTLQPAVDAMERLFVWKSLIHAHDISFPDDVLAPALAFMTPVDRFDESTGMYDRLKCSVFRVTQRLGEYKQTSLIAAELIGANEKEMGQPVVAIKKEQEPFLSIFRDALGLKDAEFQVFLQSKSSKESTTYGKARFWLTRRDGSEFPDEVLSYGQKRLASFLFYVATNRDIVIADELVNGLHHDWIELCLDQIGERQAFLTSQNPLLMDYLPFDAVEKVRDSFVLCTLDYEEESEVVTWRNMTDEEAERVFEAGEAGIEHLSTILRNEGLW